MSDFMVYASHDDYFGLSSKMRRDKQFGGYKTIVLDTEKYLTWFNARKQNNPNITHASIANKIGYGRSHLCKLLNQADYDIEISSRFIGTFLSVFGLDFDEIFTIISVDQKSGIHPQERPCSYQNSFKRFDDKNMPHVYKSR